MRSLAFLGAFSLALVDGLREIARMRGRSPRPPRGRRRGLAARFRGRFPYVFPFPAGSVCLSSIVRTALAISASLASIALVATLFL